MYASLALAACFPASALADAVVTASVSAPPGDVVAGSAVQVACWAEGRPTGGMSPSVTTINRIDVTASDGSVVPAQLTGAGRQPCSLDPARTCSVLQGSVSWTTPPTPGALTATCTAAYTTTYTFGSPAQGTVAQSAGLTTVAGAALPPVVGSVVGPGQLVAGTTGAFAVSASDPNVPPQALAYAWSASGGVITPDPSSAASASWLAPAAPGTYEVTATVSNGAGSSVSSKWVAVVLAAHQSALPAPLAVPRRICVGSGGALFAVDGEQGAIGRVALLTPRGEARGFATLPEPALALTYGAGLLWVTTAKGNVYKVDPGTGRTIGKIQLVDGPFRSPSGIAYDPANMRLWIADAGGGRVRVITPDGATAGVVDGAGGAPLVAPLDVGVDAAAGRAWVLVGTAKRAVAGGEPVAAARFLHAFDLGTRQHLASLVPYGSLAGELTRAGGLAVGAGSKVYVSDVFQGTVQVFGPDGSPVGTVGEFGEGPGRLMNPLGLAVLPNGDLAVANASLGRVDRFGNGAPLPTCAGDADCDGLPDAWEVAHGLNPHWAGDSLLDLDGDGLSNVEEFAAGTNPRNADTDGDGYPDGDELLAGYDPLDPNDHAPVVSASGPGETDPGLVRLSAVASGGGACGVGWSQTGGPAVSLRSANTANPSFVARVAGTYGFDAVAVCGMATSAPGHVQVVVRNVAPRPDAGGVVVASPGSTFQLDARASSDANGDALSFTWDQTLGRPLTGTTTGGVLTVRPRGVGLHAFQVTVGDPAGASATAEVPVLVASGPAPTAIAAALPVEAAVGSPVVLDASASFAEARAVFSWQQVAGPSVQIVAADRPVASFVPAAAGRYAFEVSVASGPLRSPPARVEVFVAAAGAALPTVSASAPAIVSVNAGVALDAAAGAGALEYAWRQVAGPAAGLTDADRPSATAVAFVPGFYVFEVSVRDGAAESRPARVAFEARAGGGAIPQARIAVPGGDAWVGQLVFLDGRASTGAARFRWSQVGGPWTPLGALGAVTAFRPLVPGVYAFELVVDDGAVRSAPARVEVNVTEGVQ